MNGTLIWLCLRYGCASDMKMPQIWICLRYEYPSDKKCLVVWESFSCNYSDSLDQLIKLRWTYASIVFCQGNRTKCPLSAQQSQDLAYWSGYKNVMTCWIYENSGIKLGLHIIAVINLPGTALIIESTIWFLLSITDTLLLVIVQVQRRIMRDIFWPLIKPPD